MGGGWGWRSYWHTSSSIWAWKHSTFCQWPDGSGHQGPIGNTELSSVWQHLRQLVSQLRSGKTRAPPMFVLHLKSCCLHSRQLTPHTLTILMLNTSCKWPHRLSPALHSRHLGHTMVRTGALRVAHKVDAFIAEPFSWTYHKCWMFWQLWSESKHSSSIEQAPILSPTLWPPTEPHTKARALMSFGSSSMFRSSSEGLVETKCCARSRFWHSWIQWHSSNVWETKWETN